MDGGLDKLSPKVRNLQRRACQMSTLSPKLFCNHQELRRLLTAFCCTQKTTDGHLFIFSPAGSRSKPEEVTGAS